MEVAPLRYRSNFQSLGARRCARRGWAGACEVAALVPGPKPGYLCLRHS